MIWLDLETRSTADVTKVGLHAFLEDPTLRILSIHWAFDDGPVRHWRGAFADGATPKGRDMWPTELFDRISVGENLMIWNEAFDRLVWNAAIGRQDGPKIRLEQVIDVAAMARSHNLPGKLETASAVWLPREMQKLGNKSFGPLWSALHPMGPEQAGLYATMLQYGDHDIVAMRALAGLMLPPDPEMLESYRAAERINQRGVGVDRDWCKAAMAFRDDILRDVDQELDDLTQGAVTSVGQYARHRTWAESQLAVSGITLDDGVTKVSKKRLRPDGAGYITKISRGFDKNVRAKLRSVLEDEAPRGLSCAPVLQMLDLLDEASGSAAVKYAAADARASSDGALRGMYIWSGASQTGRFSAGGMQPHNLIRKGVPEPSLTIDRLMTANAAEARAIAAEQGATLNGLLGRLLRPTMVPRRKDNCLVWGDWSAIEARVCPWLSGSPKAEPVLKLFRRNEDVYLAAAAGIVGHEVTKDDPARQLGKVATLSLGFGGAVGAFSAMAKNSGVPPLPRAQVQDIVDAWRATNPWARAWWDDLWEAAMSALDDPSEMYPAGRVTFVFLPALLDGTLAMILPDGRPLLYPSARVQNVYRDGDDTRPERGITFLHAAFGRMPLWYGQLAENATQATAATLLREVLVDLEFGDGWHGNVVAHTHDEVVAECRAAEAPMVAAVLRQAMEYVPDWAQGLPLAAEVKAGWAYYEADPKMIEEKT